MNSENSYVIRRFALKSVILAVFALPQWRRGYILTVGVMFAIAALIDVGIAFYRRTPIRQERLSYWEEAAAFTLMSGLCVVVARVWAFG